MKKILSLILVCAMLAGVSLAVTADKDANLIAQSISLPPALLLGHSYQFSAPSIDGESVTVSVNGQPHTESYVAEGKQAVIVYTDGAGQTLASYTLPVIDTKNSTDQCAYFCVEDGKVNFLQNENDITLSFRNNARVTFANSLNADSFALRMEMPEGKTNYGALLVTLTDATDARISVTLRLDMEKAAAACSGQSGAIDLDGSLQLSYKNQSQTFFEGDTKLCQATQNNLGEAFAGFSGPVYMSLSFEGVKGSSALALTRLCNQPLGHKNNGSPDITEPAIVVTSDLPSTLYMGDAFQLPEFVCYDVLSPLGKTSVTVELPDGSTADSDFTISQYGRYKVVFRAEDSQGNVVKSNRQFFVNDDVAPELTVSSLEKTEYALGDAVTVPGYTVSDNLDSCFVDVIALLPNGEIRVLTHDDNGQITYCLTNVALYNSSFICDESSFYVQQKGCYTLRYVAYDDQYNRSVHELTFTVK